MTPLSIIVAMTKTRVIGKNGKLPWSLPEDMKHFRETTKGHAVIMGRKTHESIGMALPGRLNLVVSRMGWVSIERGCLTCVDLETAITSAKAYAPWKDVMVIGGAEIYRLALPLVTRMYITDVEADYDGDAYFPEHDESEWMETSRRQGNGCVFRTLDRRVT